MNVVMVWKGCIASAYQTKLEAIAQSADVDLTVVVPPSWRERGGDLSLERGHTQGYRLLVEPIRFNGQHHLHYYPHLWQRLKEIRPDIIHLDEEPYSLVTWLGARYARSLGARFIFFSWQNIYRPYPPPFRWMERQVLDSADFGIMGNSAAEEVWRRKGYRGASAILPQFGVSLDLFTPAPKSDTPFVIGSASRRLNREKGVDLILQAASRLEGEWRIKIAGDGDARPELEQLARSLGIADRVEFVGKIGSEQVVAFLQQLDLLVLPSRTLPTWKEQFGRVLIEAMACELPVIGSDSGEIPNVIGDAGFIFPENDVDQLLAYFTLLQNSPALRKKLGSIGRKRALTHYTQSAIAVKTVDIYRQLANSAKAIDKISRE